MLSYTARLFISTIIALFLMWMLQLIRKHTLNIRYALSWFLLSVALLLFVWFPQLLNNLTVLVGIYSPTNLLFFVGFCLSLGIIFSLTNIVSSHAQKIKQLSQTIALMDKELRSHDE
ncbi:DUF2304 domain-containing protein [Streptococcus himalayensis]|uniref:DUF2304 domain-containing protein n=1 Tax=Streptococcus himalayensis TaxID=1888195 RepID=A0A917A552_9STRE|nr:DUF2304 domain-containing protein [Streptococcus himalayensis]GGE27870.1 hypothetical protein GCM10011510_06290 [Streptococcus himalayensis]